MIRLHGTFYEHRNRLRNASSIKTSQRQMFIYFIHINAQKKVKNVRINRKKLFFFSLNESQPELEMFEIVSTTGDHSSIW